MLQLEQSLLTPVMQAFQLLLSHHVQREPQEAHEHVKGLGTADKQAGQSQLLALEL